MKAVKIIVLAVAITALYTFWVVPQGKKMIAEWRSLCRIRAIHQQLRDGCIRIVPNREWPIN